MNWKYGMVLVGYPGKGVEILREPLRPDDEPICLLVELFQNEDGEYTSFSPANIRTPAELECAHIDVKSDGINTYFFENGSWTFEPQRDITERGYQYYWTPRDAEAYERKSAIGSMLKELAEYDKAFLDELEKQYPGKVVVYDATKSVVHGVYASFKKAVMADTPKGSSVVCFPAKSEKEEK